MILLCCILCSRSEPLYNCMNNSLQYKNNIIIIYIIYQWGVISTLFIAGLATNSCSQTYMCHKFIHDYYREMDTVIHI